MPTCDTPIFLVYLGRFAEADPYIQRAEDLDPFGSQTLVRIGQLRYLEHRFPEGLDMMAKAASVAPAMVAPRFMSGIMLGASGRVDDAIKDLKKIEDRYPQGRQCTRRSRWPRVGVARRPCS